MNRNRGIVVALSVIAAAFGMVGLVGASGGITADAAPAPGSLGAPVTVRVLLHAPGDGKPAANAPVVFHTDASFAGVTDEVELGRAVSNAEGVAALTFTPHVAGDHEVRVDYEDAGRKVNLGKATFSVADDGQLYRSTAGVRIPGLNVWLLIGLVAAIWSVLLSVAFRVIAIARSGPRNPEELHSNNGQPTVSTRSTNTGGQ